MNGFKIHTISETNNQTIIKKPNKTFHHVDLIFFIGNIFVNIDLPTLLHEKNN